MGVPKYSSRGNFYLVTMYTIGEFADLTGVSKRTLVRCDLDGILVAYRSPSGRRYYSEEQCSVYKIAGHTESENKEQYSAYKKVSRTKKVNEVYLRAFSGRREVVTQEQIDELKVYCEQKLGIQVELINFLEN